MNIATICTSNFTNHLIRWLRYVKKSNPLANLYLIWIGDVNINIHNPLFKEFKSVKIHDNEYFNREGFNSLRMDLTNIFSIDEVVYVDCDCDIFENIDQMAKEEDRINGNLLCCRSPSPRMSWIQYHMDHYGKVPEVEYNNGFLWMNKSYKYEYKKCWDNVKDVNDRIRGTFAFNIMLKDMRFFRELDYKYSVIWSDIENIINAKCLQYCNDQGQSKRLHLEELYQATKCIKV